MAVSDEPWQIDGVSAEARAAAEAAAAHEGLDLGAWLDAAIREAAEAGAAGHPTTPVVAAIDALNDRVAIVEAAAQQSLEPLRDRLSRLLHRIAELEHAAAQRAGERRD